MNFSPLLFVVALLGSAVFVVPEVAPPRELPEPEIEEPPRPNECLYLIPDRQVHGHVPLPGDKRCPLPEIVDPKPVFDELHGWPQ